MNQPEAVSPPEPLALRDLTVVLVKHYGVHEGLWDLNLELTFALGQIGPTREKALPGAMIGVQRIGLTRTPKENAGPNTVDAAEVNQAKGAE